MAKKEVKIGSISIKPNSRNNEFVPTDTDNYILGKTKKDVHYAEKVLCGVKNNFPVLLIGPAGCGKTSLIKWLASETKNGYRRIQLNGSTGIDNFVGKWLINKNGTFWCDGILTDAMRKGHWLLLDEINASLPEILFVLHSILDDDRVLILDEKDKEVVTPHPDFRLFAAMNPESEYAGTKELNKALLDRFPIVLETEYSDVKKEIDIIEKHTKLPKEFCKRLVELGTILRKKNKDPKTDLMCPISTRLLIQWALLCKDFGIKDASEVCLLTKILPERRNIAIDEINKLFRDEENVPISKLKATELKATDGKTGDALLPEEEKPAF